jgi:hypothetical protein
VAVPTKIHGRSKVVQKPSSRIGSVRRDCTHACPRLGSSIELEHRSKRAHLTAPPPPSSSSHLAAHVSSRSNRTRRR